jgi:hypothetical protein
LRSSSIDSPLHLDSRYSSRERGCVPFIRFFGSNVKKKMHVAPGARDAARLFQRSNVDV